MSYLMSTHLSDLCSAEIIFLALVTMLKSYPRATYMPETAFKNLVPMPIP